MPVLMIELKEYELALLEEIFGRITVVDIGQQGVPETPVEHERGPDGSIQMYLTPVNEAGEAQQLPPDVGVGGEVDHIDPQADPSAPENLGIRLEEPAPPTLVEEGTENSLGPTAYGAGPPPRDE